MTKSGFRENTEAIIVAVILALFIRTFIVQPFKIPSGSMKETLQIGDHILVNKFTYGIRLPYLNAVVIPGKHAAKGDIVVFKFPLDPGKDFIKRVVGTAGDTVEIRDKTLLINHSPVSEPYAVFKDPHLFPGNIQPRDNFGPVTVPENALFVMGDNRDNSHDGRFWGYVDLSELKGRAFLIYWSWDSAKSFGLRWERIFDRLK